MEANPFGYEDSAQGEAGLDSYKGNRNRVIKPDAAHGKSSQEWHPAVFMVTQWVQLCRREWLACPQRLARLGVDLGAVPAREHELRLRPN